MRTAKRIMKMIEDVVLDLGFVCECVSSYSCHKIICCMFHMS